MQKLPDYVSPLAAGETFSFACHPGVACFTDCCRELELALTPYDVLRLKNFLNLSAAEFLDRYVLVEQSVDEVFPRLYLAMVDDGRASCPFVDDSGCTVYEARPGACRTYPLGRGVSRNGDGSCEQRFVLLREKHCLGFEEQKARTAGDWTEDQGLARYNEMNDLLLPLLQHHKVKAGIRLPESLAEMFLVALYDLDRFREILAGSELFRKMVPDKAEQEKILGDETERLRFAVGWLRAKLFGDPA